LLSPTLTRLDTKNNTQPGSIAVRGKPPLARTGHAAVLVGQKLYIIGGFASSGRFLRSVVVLDTETWTWSVPGITGTGPPPLAYHSADLVVTRTAGVRRLIYVFGGVTPVMGPDGPAQGPDGPLVHALGSVHVLDVTDPATATWATPPVTGVGPSPRAWHASCASGSEIFVFGGSEVSVPSGEGGSAHAAASGPGYRSGFTTRLTGDFFCLDTRTMSWQEVIPATPLPPAHPAAAAKGVGYGRAPCTWEGGLWFFGFWFCSVFFFFFFFLLSPRW
jgi:hypothetical protein